MDNRRQESEVKPVLWLPEEGLLAVLLPAPPHTLVISVPKDSSQTCATQSQKAQVIGIFAAL
jgi:hypothetical protein